MGMSWLGLRGIDAPSISRQGFPLLGQMLDNCEKFPLQLHRETWEGFFQEPPRSPWEAA